MNKILLFSLILSLSLFASEIQLGRGDFSADAAFLGLSNSKNEQISSVSLVNEHKNIFSSEYFYSYKLAYYKSKTLTTDYTTSSTLLGTSNNNLLIYNKLRGIDLNMVLGKDLINQDNGDTYLGIGILTGASFPYIKTKSNSDSTKQSLKYLKKSKTKFYTYKLGISLKVEEKINGFINFYSNTAYALQTARVKNSILHLNSSSNGNYFTFNTGLKFQVKTKKKIGFITLLPTLFATFGYRYDYWKVNNVKINSLQLDSDIDLQISQFYLGLGYDF